MTKTAATMILLAAIPGAAMANVATTDHRQAVTVSFADLDLTQQAGQKSLYQRLKVAASRVCGPTSIRKTGSVTRMVENRQCYDEALDNVVEQLDMPAIKELHAR